MEDTTENRVKDNIVLSKVETIAPPRWMDKNRDELRAFKEEWEKYLVDVAAYADKAGIECAKLVQSVRHVIPQKTLRSPARFELKVELENLTNDMILAWIDSELDSTAVTVACAEADLKKRLRMDLKIKDASTRVRAYWTRAEDLVQDNGYAKVIGSITDENAMFCGILIDGVQPEALRRELDANLRLAVNKAAKRDAVELYDLVKRLAIEQQREHDKLRMDAGKSNGKRIRDDDDHRDARDQKRHRGSTARSPPRNRFGRERLDMRDRRRDERRERDHRRPGSRDGKYGDSKPTGGDIKVHLDGCIKCGSQSHRLDFHKDLGPDERSKLWDAFNKRRDEARKDARVFLKKLGQQFDQLRQKKDARERGASRSHDRHVGRNHLKVMKMLHSEPDAPMTVVLNDCFSMDALPDCGATGNPCISRKNLAKLQELDPTVKVVPLYEPVVHEAVGGHLITAKESVWVKIRIVTASGPVSTYRPFECHVINEDEDQFLISRPVLVSLGIDVDDQLNQLARALQPRATQGDDDDFGDGRCDQLPSCVSAEPGSVNPNLDVEEMIKKALELLPKEYEAKLRAIVSKHDIWRSEFDPKDPPADVPPLDIELKDGAEPYIAKTRPYSREDCEFMTQYNDMLVKGGIVKEVSDNRWASRVLLVKKKGHNLSLLQSMRQVVDMVMVNTKVKPLAGQMPRSEYALSCAAGKPYHAVLDFVSGFWQILVTIRARKILAYRTHNKVFENERMPQGFVDSALYFQKMVEIVLGDLIPLSLAVWVDDILTFARTIDEHLELLETIFDRLHAKGFKLHAKKCVLFATEVKWCGKLVSDSGIQHDGARIQGLVDMSLPRTAGGLMQFLCACNWLRDSIPDYARTAAALQAKLEASISGRKRTKRVASGISLDWTLADTDAFAKLKTTIASSVKRSFPDADATMCLFTDASDSGWSVVVSQVRSWDNALLAHEQQHEMLACQSGTFTGPQVNWSIIDKEAYPIVHACVRLEWLLMVPSGFRMFCDHRNLVHIFAPDDDVKKHIRGRLLRWAARIMTYRYTIEHIGGEDNLWADLISRWGCTTTSPVAWQAKRYTRRTNKKTPTLPSTLAIRPLGNLVWPSMADIGLAQASVTPPPDVTPDDFGIYHDKTGKVWLPPSATELLQRLCIVAHCGQAGHRGHDATLRVLQDVFVCANLSNFVQAFLDACLLCPHVKGGRVVRRPWGEKLRGKWPNQVLHWDFLFLGESYGSSKYLLVLKDDASHFVRLVPCDSCTGQVAAEAMLWWVADFGSPRYWISDSGTHFKNSLLAMMSKMLRCQLDTIVAHSPWINGSVERVNRDVLQLMRLMLLDLKLPPTEWLYLVPMIQFNLNHTPVKSLNGHAPVEVMTGLGYSHPIKTVLVPDRDEPLEVSWSNEEIDRHMLKLRSSLEKIHKEVSDERDKQKLLNQKLQRGEHVVNFDVGDFVLRSRVDAVDGSKLSVMWIGPYQVIGATRYNAFEVEHVVTGKTLTVHASRLKYYHDPSLGTKEDLVDHVAAQGQTLDVEALINHRWSTTINDYEVKVQWLGLEPIEASWEPLGSIASDVPKIVNKYAQDANDKKLQRHLNLEV
jgi:hypothetical protein